RFDDPWISDNRGSGYLRLTLPESSGVLAAVDGRTGEVAWKHELRGARLATSGPLTTAGGLLFWGSADGRLEAFDAGTGERLWAFQAGPPGVRLRPGPAVAYAAGGEQRLAMAVGGELWAFALDGDVPARPAATEPLDDLVRWIGPPPRATDTVETATLVENPIAWSVGGRRNAINEHAFNPVRARVGVGTRLRFVNNGTMTHTIAARDGSWTTEALAPAMSGYVTLDEPGTFLYHCTEHPWAIGEITVEP
ncbi:MAG: PQQ-binding-like beta-propeller repeat protein, partial [Acidobacteria bacterium]|nr:PQQ-binding-like beta-propeller repeat protein [Acidobacteriota bacterium]